MHCQKWYDKEDKTHKVFLELTPVQARKLFNFLLEQLAEDFPPKTLSTLGEITEYVNGVTTSLKGIITIGVVE